MNFVLNSPPEESEYRRELGQVLQGLSGEQKVIPVKYLYDESGANLFKAICQTPEYYHTRTEIALLTSHAKEIEKQTKQIEAIIEPGSGSSAKVRVLLDNFSNVKAYFPIDIERKQLWREAEALSGDYKQIKIFPVAGDYTQDLLLPSELKRYQNRLVFYPGSSISNFYPLERQVLWTGVLGRLAGLKGFALIGVDLIKDKEIIEAAYNDQAGFTAAFNLNALKNLNKKFYFSFQAKDWKHRAFYNQELERVEMRLKCLRSHQMQVGNVELIFKRGESILTEVSYKFDADNLQSVLSDSWKLKRSWIDEKKLFAILLAERR
jgi:dimethylhistidine N-methyltransferase